MIPRTVCDIDSQLMFKEPKTRGLSVNNSATALHWDEMNPDGNCSRLIDTGLIGVQISKAF